MIPEVVKAAVDAAFPGAEATITLRAPETHQSNQLFEVWSEGRHFIAKQYLKEDEWETAPAREHASLQFLEPLDIAPRPFFYEAALGPVVVYEYMDGRMWGRYHPSTEELEQLAVAMAGLHQLPTDGIWLARGAEWTVEQRVVWFHELLDSYALWSATEFPLGEQIIAICRPMIAQAGEVLKQFYETMPALVFCRSDPRFANVIRRPDGRFGFVDWEDAGLRDPALEVADMILHPEQEDLLAQEEWQRFLSTYCQAAAFEQEKFTRRVHEIGLVMPLFWILIMMRYGVRLGQSGRLAGWQVNEMPANLRLQRYWARAMAGSMFDFDPGDYADVLFFPTS